MCGTANNTWSSRNRRQHQEVVKYKVWARLLWVQRSGGCDLEPRGHHRFVRIWESLMENPLSCPPVDTDSLQIPISLCLHSTTYTRKEWVWKMLALIRAAEVLPGWNVHGHEAITQSGHPAKKLWWEQLLYSEHKISRGQLLTWNGSGRRGFLAKKIGQCPCETFRERGEINYIKYLVLGLGTGARVTAVTGHPGVLKCKSWSHKLCHLSSNPWGRKHTRCTCLSFWACCPTGSWWLPLHPGENTQKCTPLVD